MKKRASIIFIAIVVIILMLSGNIYAKELDAIDIQTSKTNVKPGEDVKLNINFGQALGSYTFYIAYDNSIFEFVSADGGTATDTSDKIIVVYYDTTGGQNPKNSESITFKAKENITTSNPTEFSVTAEGLANNDATVMYDDITVPIIKNLIVEPEYIDYNLKLEYSGDIIPNKPKDMKFSYSSSMGRYYKSARLIAEATTPDGATVNLKAIDSNKLEHDIIQSGWGDAQGYEIGGKDFAQILNVEGTFSKEGKYSITLKLIDRDNSDSIIAQKTFDLVVGEKQVQAPTDTNTTLVGNTVTNTTNTVNTTNTTTPTTLPKTGINLYVVAIIVLSSLLGIFIYHNRKK